MVLRYITYLPRLLGLEIMTSQIGSILNVTYKSCFKLVRGFCTIP